EGMDVNFANLHLEREGKQSLEMLDVRMDSAVGEKAHEMHAAGPGRAGFEGFTKERNLEKLSLPDFFRDAGEILVNDPARSHRHVADFAVSHHTLGKTDGLSMGEELGVGILLEKLFQE